MEEPGFGGAPETTAEGQVSPSIDALLEENRRLRAELARLSPLAEVGLLSAGAAHDLNNLLQLVAGHAAQLRPAIDADREALRLLDQATDSACGLAQRLARWAKDDGARGAASDLAEVVAQVTRLAAPAAPVSVTLRFELADPLPPARIDERDAHRIVLNLLLNAWHALHDATGEVVIRTGRSDSGGVWVEVEDTGAGMSEDARLRLFEPFFSSHAAGSGLGLATIRSLVEAAGGAIEVWSATGQGSRFRITLDAAELSGPARA